MVFQDDIDRLKYDTRLLDYHFKHGLISKEEYDKHLASLADANHNAEKVKLFEETVHTNGHTTEFPEKLN